MAPYSPVGKKGRGRPDAVLLDPEAGLLSAPSLRPGQAPQAQGGAAVPLAPRFGSSSGFSLGLGLGTAPSLGLDLGLGTALSLDLNLGLRTTSGFDSRATTSLTPRSWVALRMDPGLRAALGRDVAATVVPGRSSTCPVCVRYVSFGSHREATKTHDLGLAAGRSEPFRFVPSRPETHEGISLQENRIMLKRKKKERTRGRMGKSTKWRRQSYCGRRLKIRRGSMKLLGELVALSWSASFLSALGWQSLWPWRMICARNLLHREVARLGHLRFPWATGESSRSRLARMRPPLAVVAPPVIAPPPPAPALLLRAASVDRLCGTGGDIMAGCSPLIA